MGVEKWYCSPQLRDLSKLNFFYKKNKMQGNCWD